MRKTMLLALPLAVLGMFAVSAVPAGAVPGVGAGLTVLSPNLDNGFPCQGGGPGGLYSFQKWLVNQVGLPTTPCTGTIFPGSVANFVGSGVSSGGQPYAFAGTGGITGSYYYSEPCQPTPAGQETVSGEAYGASGAPTTDGGLTLNLTSAVGVVGSTPITRATVHVNFWWSRVGLTAIVGLRNIQATVNGGQTLVSDPNASGVASAIFIPVSPPNCTQTPPSTNGGIEIISNTLTAGA